MVNKSPGLMPPALAFASAQLLVLLFYMMQAAWLHFTIAAQGLTWTWRLRCKEQTKAPVCPNQGTAWCMVQEIEAGGKVMLLAAVEHLQLQPCLFDANASSCWIPCGNGTRIVD